MDLFDSLSGDPDARRRLWAGLLLTRSQGVTTPRQLALASALTARSAASTPNAATDSYRPDKQLRPSPTTNGFMRSDDASGQAEGPGVTDASGSGPVEETISEYGKNLRDLGIDPDNTEVDPRLAKLMQSILQSADFRSVAKPIFDKDVGLKKETGGVQVYLSGTGDYDDPSFQWKVKSVPYEGKPEANPSPAATAGIDLPDPDPSQGIPLFEWHPHPIRQPGGNLPSERDLDRTVQPLPGVTNGLPGAIWYNGHPLFDDYETILYQAHRLAGRQ